MSIFDIPGFLLRGLGFLCVLVYRFWPMIVALELWHATHNPVYLAATLVICAMPEKTA